MSNEEAKIVLEIMAKVDGSCSSCASDAFRELVSAFPQYESLAWDIYWQRFNKGWFDE